MKAQIYALTSTRAVAAIMVVIHHFAADVFPFNKLPKLFHSGNIAVSYFFVLSGFVLYISYNGLNTRFADYFKRRVGRIVPVYLLALGLMVCVLVAFYSYPLNSASFKEIVLSVLLLQAYVPSYPMSLNTPGWTISVEMFFYLLFPLFLLFINKNFRAFVVTTLVLFILAQYFHFKYYNIRWGLPDSIIDTVFFNPVMHISQFLIGMTGGYLFERSKPVLPSGNRTPVILFCVIVALLAFRPDNISYHVGLIAPVFMLFVLSIAVNNPKWLNIKGFVFLGEISYGIYILQRPVYKFLEVLNGQYTHLPNQYFFIIAFVFLLVISALSYLFIEKPLRRKINSLKFA